MTRIFLDKSKIEDFYSFDIYEDLNDIFEEDELGQNDWFGVDDPEI